MVGVLRDEAEAQYVPQPGVADIERLARSVDGGPRVDVRLAAGLDGISPSVAAALYRIAQEAVTNALRHARHASRITVEAADEGDVVRLEMTWQTQILPTLGTVVYPLGYDAEAHQAIFAPLVASSSARPFRAALSTREKFPAT